MAEAAAISVRASVPARKTVLILPVRGVDEAQFALSAGHQIDDLAGAAAQVMQPEPGPLRITGRQEPMEGGGEDAGLHGSDAQAALLLFSPRDLVLQLRKGGQRVVGLLQELPAPPGRPHAGMGALKDRIAQLALQVFDGKAQGGLGDEQSLRGVAQGAEPLDFDDVLDLPQGHEEPPGWF